MRLRAGARGSTMERRTFLGALGAPLLVAGVAGAAAQAPQPVASTPAPRKGRLKQGVTRGVFARTGLSLDDMCREAAKLGIEGFDLIGPAEWPVWKKYGI